MASGDSRKQFDKRKAGGSPEMETLQPRLRRRGSLPDLQDASDPKRTYSLPDLMKKGFQDPEVFQDVIPTIMKQLQPTIEAKIESTIKASIEKSMASSITNAVDSALRKFKDEVMDSRVIQKDSEISMLKDEISRRDEKVKVLEDEVGKISKGLNDLEQYGRRQSIRLNNERLDDVSECETVVINILNRALPEAESISSDDIDRCHPIGRLNKKNNRQMIVKFRSYKTKAKVCGARFNLSNVYMSEDFTPSNQKIIDKLVQSKKAKKVKKFWSIDGKIFAKAHDLQPKVRINSVDDIEAMISSAIEEGYMLDRETGDLNRLDDADHEGQMDFEHTPDSQ